MLEVENFGSFSKKVREIHSIESGIANLGKSGPKNMLTHANWFSSFYFWAKSRLPKIEKIANLISMDQKNFLGLDFRRDFFLKR